MFIYYLRLALISIKRNPILSALMVAAIALGIGASMTTVTVNYLMSADPIPHKSSQLYYVQLDNWSPHNAWDDDFPERPPNQITFTEATNLSNADKAFRQAAMGTSGSIIQPQGQDEKPFEAYIRLTYADFFPMFDTPFLYGSGWDKQADDNRELVIVISQEMNDRIFGGKNSVGENIVMAGQNFRVVGVLAEWQPVPKFYDLSTGPFNDAEDVYIPFILKQELELPNWGNNNCWKSPDGDSFEAFLRSECVNSQMWVELPTEQDKQAYLDFLSAYVEQQKALGRFPRPINNKLSNVMEWMELEGVVADDAQIMMWLSFMFLAVCLLNTIGLLLAKFTAKSSEIGLRRAVGASKSALFYQHLVESAMIGLFGGIVGLGLAVMGLQGVKTLYGDFVDDLAALDANMVVLALALSLLSAVLAGLYPTWRACNIAPASQLKSQ